MTREFVENARGEFVLKGSWTKADLFLVAVPGGSVVVKDFAAKSAPIRALGRLQIARECAAYRTLEGVEGIARWLGRVDAHALAVERVEGTFLRTFRKRPADRRRELLESLRGILDSVHARGIIHNDLRGKDNALVRSDGGLVLIDFAGAFLFRPGSIPHRWLFRRLARVDQAAFLKWKTILDPDAITPEERQFLRRFARFRRLWIFNTKGALRPS